MTSTFGSIMFGIISRIIVEVTLRMPKWFVRWVSRRYVAGSQLSDAVKVMNRLSSEGACFTIDVLGEEISTLDEATFFLEEYERVIDAIITHDLDSNLSIKPTAFGLLIDKDRGMENIERLIKKAAENQIFVRLDMEDHRVTDDTIQVVLEMHAKGLKNVGCVLQGRLFRTPNDITFFEEKLGVDADFRICKGIYLEPEDIAHVSRKSIISATNECIRRMIDSGSYVGIASHDYPVINYAINALEKAGLGPNLPDPRSNSASKRENKGHGYEFQMLLGVRGQLRRKLRKAGHMTRVYIPYGEKWYEYSIRRLRENPTVATQVVKAFLMPWSNRP